MLIGLTILTVISAGLLLWGWKDGNDDALMTGGMMLVLTGLFGWLLLGNMCPVSSKDTEMTASVLHDKNASHLSVDGVIVATYNDVATFNYLADRETVKVIKNQTYNMYGGLPKGPTWTISNNQ